MEKKELVNIDIRFLFVLLTTYIAIWIFLYDYIVVQTTNLETYYMILIGLLHYTIFVFIVPTVVLLFYKGLSYTDINDELIHEQKITKIINNCKNFVMKWWLFIFLNVLLLTVFNVIFLSLNVWLVIFVLIVSIVLYMPIRGINSPLKKLNINILWTSITFVGFIIYVFFLSLFASDVIITTDKDFYKVDDIVRIEVKRKGYFLLPEIKSITLNGGYEKDKKHETFSFRIYENEYNDGYFNFIEVKYKPQLFFQKNKIQPIRITKE